MRVVLLLVACLTVSHGLYFHFDDEPVCLGFKATQQRMNFYYEIFGRNTDGVIIDIERDNGEHIHRFEESQSSIEFGAQHPYHICFQSADGQSKEVLMDLWTDEEDHVKQLAVKDEFYEVHNALAKANGRIRRIAQLEKFQQKRQESHAQIIMQNEQTIKHYGLLKVVVIVVVALGQLLVIKNLLTKKQFDGFLSL